MPLPQNADTVRRFVAYLHTLHLPPLECRTKKARQGLFTFGIAADFMP